MDTGTIAEAITKAVARDGPDPNENMRLAFELCVPHCNQRGLSVQYPLARETCSLPDVAMSNARTQQKSAESGDARKHD